MIPEKFTGFVKFSAAWCAPCKAFAPLVKKVVADRGIDLMIVDIDKEPDLAKEWSVRSVPTLISFGDGEPLGSFSGSLPETELYEFASRSGFRGDEDAT
jgi:thioredoxin-like negative regulator of GroEL